MPRSLLVLALLLLATTAVAQQAAPAADQSAAVRYTIETMLTAEDADPLRLPVMERLMGQERLGHLETEEAAPPGGRRTLRVRAVFGFASTAAFQAWYDAAATRALLAELRAEGTPPFRAFLSVQRLPGR